MRNIKIGVEIEFFGVNYNTVIDSLRDEGIDVDFLGYTHQVTRAWKLVTDVSVNGSNTGLYKGLELVSPILLGDEGLDELEVVLNVLNSIGARVDKSCGVHVHHDIADYEVENLVSLHNLYYNYSTAIDSIMPKSRRAGSRNSYCKPLSYHALLDIQDATSMRQCVHYMASRYFTLNCQSYLKYGTIEFRQHSGTTEFEKIEAWIVFTHCMLNFCRYNKVHLKSGKSSSIRKLLELLNLDGSFAGNYLMERKAQLCA